MKLIIEWRHFEEKGETCNRCYDTGENIKQEVEKLKKMLQSQGIDIELKIIKLNDQSISESNSIYLNGTPIEKILDIKVSESFCESCSSLIGRKTNCRTIIYEGNEYEEVPVEAIRKAVLKIVGLELSENTKTKCQCKQNKCC